MDYASEIKSRVTMPEMMRRYGFKLNRQNRMPCPFHNGNDCNFGVKDDFYHCFVCGCSGDAISFVQNYFGLDYPKAVEKINEDFSLGLPFGERITLRRRREMERKQKERMEERERCKKEQDRLVAAYWAAFDVWKKYDTDKREYAPKASGDDFSSLFVEAAMNIDMAAYALSEAEMRLRDYETNR